MDPQSARVNYFIEKYSSLVKYAEGLAFPSYRRKLPNGADTWNRPKKVLFRLSHPFTVEDTGFWDSMGYLVLVFLMQTNIGWGLMLLAPALFRMPTLLSFSNLGAAISLIIAFICAIPLAIVSCFWWYQILTSKEYRVIWRIVLVLMGGFLVWAFTQSIRNASITKQLIGSRADILPLITSYVFFLIPALSYLLIIGLESIIQITQLLRSISGGITSMHNPLPFEQLRRLAIEEIPSMSGQMPWKLSSLSLHEIQTLRKWAEANRESTDKRALPAIVIFGFLALLLNTDTVKRSIVEPIFQFWWDEITFFWMALQFSPSVIFSWRSLVATLVMVITLILVRYTLRTSLRLFRNLPVQSLVIEACLLVESAQDSNYPVDTKIQPERQRRGVLSMLRQLFDLLS